MAATRGSTPPLVLELAARPWLVPAAGGLCGIVVLAVLVLDLSAGIRCGLLAALCVAGAGVRRTVAALAAPARLEWEPAGTWRVQGAAMRLRPATMVLAGLVVLVLRGTRTRRYWITRGSLDPVTFRRLKMRLRHVAAPAAGAAGSGRRLLESRGTAER
jgi:hypothetical protein